MVGFSMSLVMDGHGGQDVAGDRSYSAAEGLTEQ